MPKRKLIIEVDINDDMVNSIEDLEREILAQDICGQAAWKYLDSLQEDMVHQSKIREGREKVQIKTPHFEFDFHAKRTLDGTGKTLIVPYLHNQDKTLLDFRYYPSWKYLCTITSFSEAYFLTNILQ